MTPQMTNPSLFEQPLFWSKFQDQIEQKVWKSYFERNILQHTLSHDLKLYPEGTVLKRRRQVIQTWLDRDDQWQKLLLDACSELGQHKIGPSCRVLKDIKVLEALVDFVDHIEYFYSVASAMSSYGEVVQPVIQRPEVLGITTLGQDEVFRGLQNVPHYSVSTSKAHLGTMPSMKTYSYSIHDIDKLDPVMLAGYSERFEDNVVTSLWDACVERHVHVNPHHQAHRMWHGDGAEVGISKAVALREMVCDKVSRRLQKELNGVVSPDMWNVDKVFFEGLPKTWMDKAQMIINLMKRKEIRV